MNHQPQEDVFEGLDWSLLMEQIGNTLTRRTSQLTNDNCQKPVVNSQLTINNRQLLKDEEIEQVLLSVDDLISDNLTYRSWYISRIIALGASEFLARADRARKYGRNKPAYFSKIVKLS